MINSFKRKPLKWSIAGVLVIILVGSICLLNPKVVSSAPKKILGTDSTNLNAKNTPSTESEAKLPLNFTVDKVKSALQEYIIKIKMYDGRDTKSSSIYIANDMSTV